MSIYRHSALFKSTTCICSIMGALLVASTGAHAQQTLFEPTLSIRELYTDNVTLTDKNTKSDFVTTATAGLTITRQSPRVQLYLSGSAAFDKYAERSELDGFRPSLLGVATAEVVESKIFLDTRASVVERALRRSTPGPSVARTTSTEQTRITNFSITPQLVHDFDGRAQAQVLVGYSATLFGKTDVGTNAATIQDTNTFNAAASLSSSWRASRIRWQWNNSYLENNRSNRQISTDGVLEYALKQGLIPFVRVGYDDVQDRFLNNNKRSGPVYSAGLSWIPGSRLSFRGEIGHRFGGISGAASLDFAISSSLNLAISYSEGISTQQQALTSALGLLEFADAGTLGGGASAPFLVDNVGAPAQLGNNALTLNNSSFKSQNLTVGLNGVVRSTTVFVRGYHITRKFDANSTTPEADETVAGVSLQLSRQLSNGLAVNIGGTYSETLDPRIPTEDDTRVTGRAGLSYGITTALSTSINYDYRNLQTKIGDAVENAFTVYLFLTF